MKRLFSLPLLALAFTACQTETSVTTDPVVDTTATADRTPMATAQLVATEGNTVSGTITFMQEASGVRVQGTIMGLTPGEHGFHVHENGDCGPGPDGTPAGAAGGHFAPSGSPHGAPTAAAGQRHEGDLGNVTAGDDGSVTVDMIDPVLTLEGPNGIVGKALIVHANPDDLTTQPTGNAGGRVSCGIIQMGAAVEGSTRTPGGIPGGTMDGPANPVGGTGETM